MKFMGMITIGWSLKQRHQRQASIMSLYFNLPFAAIALIFLMGCSLGKFSFLFLTQNNNLLEIKRQDESMKYNIYNLWL